MPSEIDEIYWKIEQHANYLMDSYKRVREEGQKLERPVDRGVYKASWVTYLACLEDMKDCGLIRDYNTETGEIFL